jgi:ABC-type dipeptide/oligopeptide/nickel transport system ATPase component
VGSKVAKIAAQMTGFKAVDNTTVEFTLASPNADLPTILALHHFMIVADGTTDFSKGNGTGAFVRELFEPGVRSVGVRNKNYWKAGPNLDSFDGLCPVWLQDRWRNGPGRRRRHGRHVREKAAVRGAKIAYVPQSAAAAFNPAIRIMDQVTEVVRIHRPAWLDSLQQDPEQVRAYCQR